MITNILTNPKKKKILILAIYACVLICTLSMPMCVYADNAADAALKNKIQKFMDETPDDGMKGVAHAFLMMSFNGPTEFIKFIFERFETTSLQGFFTGTGSTAAMAPAVYSVIQACGIILVTYFFFAAMFTAATEERISYELILKQFLHLLLGVVLINLSAQLVATIWDAGNELGRYVLGTISMQDGANPAFGQAIDDYNSMGIGVMALVDVLSIIIKYMLSYVMGIISCVVAGWLLASRVVEFAVRSAFTPIAIADIAKNGMQARGIVYLKKLFAIALQLAAIAIVLIVGSYASSVIFLGISSESSVWQGTYGLVATIVTNFATVGVMVKSQSLCNDVVGV